MSATALAERDRIVAELQALIAAATDEEIAYISEADLTAGPVRLAKYEASLRTILFKRNGHMLAEKHSVLPGEVLGLIAEDIEEHLGNSFEIATACLMITSLLEDDADGAMALLWAENAEFYADVAPRYVAPLLSGFRWLSENATAWSFLNDRAHEVPSRQEIVRLSEEAQG